MSCGIYKITNIVSKHAYIGKSVNTEERLKSHFSETKLFNTESVEYNRQWHRENARVLFSHEGENN